MAVAHRFAPANLQQFLPGILPDGLQQTIARLLSRSSAALVLDDDHQRFIHQLAQESENLRRMKDERGR